MPPVERNWQISYRTGSDLPSTGGDLFDLESYSSNANAPLLSSEDIRFYHQVRCNNGELPLEDPEFYPLVAKDFSGLPPSEVFSADIDPLRDDSALYVEKLNQAGGHASGTMRLAWCMIIYAPDIPGNYN